MRKCDVSVQSTEQEILQTAKWNHTLCNLIWLLFLILFIFEGIVAICYCMGITLNARFNSFEFVVLYFILPSIVVLMTVLISFCIIMILKKLNKVHAESTFILMTLLIVVSEVIAFHHGISIVYVIYILPIVSSLFFVKPRMLLITYLSSIVMYFFVLLYVYLAIPDNEFNHNYMDILGTIAMLTAVYALCRMVLQRIRELIDTAVDETRLRAKLSHEVSLDSLTQLYNHAYFYQCLDSFILNYKEDKTKRFSLILMDIDNFKLINDTYGHAVGDQVILRLVDTIKELISKNDYAFRYGGEEFAILTHGSDNAYNLAESIRLNYSKEVFEGIPHGVTISLGLNSFNDTYGGKREFFSSVDEALYRAKFLGKNCVCTVE